VVLEDGRRLSAPTVVLAQGMVQAEPDAEVTALTGFAERFALRYAPPGMPAEREYTDLPAGETVLVRGLGANFFDVIGQLVAEWGGAIEPVPGDPHGRLRYLPSGANRTSSSAPAAASRTVPSRAAVAPCAPSSRSGRTTPGSTRSSGAATSTSPPRCGRCSAASSRWSISKR